MNALREIWIIAEISYIVSRPGLFKLDNGVFDIFYTNDKNEFVVKYFFMEDFNKLSYSFSDKYLTLTKNHKTEKLKIIEKTSDKLVLKYDKTMVTYVKMKEIPLSTDYESFTSSLTKKEWKLESDFIKLRKLKFELSTNPNQVLDKEDLEVISSEELISIQKKKSCTLTYENKKQSTVFWEIDSFEKNYFIVFSFPLMEDDILFQISNVTENQIDGFIIRANQDGNKFYHSVKLIAEN